MRPTSRYLVATALGIMLLACGLLPPGSRAGDGPSPPPAASPGIQAPRATPIPYRYPDPIDRQARAWEAKAIVAVDAGDWAEVVRTTSLALGRNQEALSAWINRGLAYWHLGESGKALADWNRAVALAPNNGEARFDRGLALQLEGHTAAAREDLTFACRREIRPACLAIGDRLGTMTVAELLDATVAAFNQQDYTEALRLSDAVLAREPANPVALTNRCGALVSLGRPDAAMQACTKAMDLEPDFALAYNNFGVAWEQKGDVASAHIYYELACRRGLPLGCANRDRLAEAASSAKR